METVITDQSFYMIYTFTLRCKIYSTFLFAVFCRQSRVWSSTVSFSDLDEKGDMEYDDNYSDSKRELRPQSVDPKKGWDFRGVHRVWT